MSALTIFKNNSLRRLYRLSKRRETSYEKPMDTPLHFYQVQNYPSQPKEKA